MPNPSRQRALAVCAVLSSSVVPALGLAATPAHAADPGPANSTLTISDGSSTVLVGGRPVAFPTRVTDATWAPNGSRLAFVDAAGDLVSTLPDGTGMRVLARGGPGIVISSPTWSSDAAGVAFAESVHGRTGPLKVAKADGYGAVGKPDGTTVADAPNTTDGAAYSAPDAIWIADGTAPSLNIVPNYVFQRSAGGGPAEIWSFRNYARSVQPYKLADGSDPTVSPDGKTVASITAAGQVAVVDISNPFKPSAPKVLTSGPGRKSHPAFSPDGTTIAFETAGDVETIAATGGKTTVVARHPGVPAYRPAAVTHVTRLAGADRIGTAIAISRAEFGNPDYPTPWGGRPTNVVLARSDQYADALAGSVLAGNAPLLLTPPTELDPAVKAEIVRVLGPAKGTTKTVTLLGGDQALSPDVQKEVEALGYHVQRFGGADRYATAVAIAEHLTAHSTGSAGPQKIVVATGENFADALSASTLHAPIVLTDDKAMPASTAAYLKSAAAPGSDTTIVPVGGPAKTATATLWPAGTPGAPKITPLAGIDRYETSFLVARAFFGPDPRQLPGRLYLGVATAANWPDSLAGGPAMANLDGPLLLVDPQTGLSPEERQWVSANAGSIDSALAFGGPAALPRSVDAQVGGLLSGPAGFVDTSNPSSIPQ